MYEKALNNMHDKAYELSVLGYFFFLKKSRKRKKMMTSLDTKIDFYF